MYSFEVRYFEGSAFTWGPFPSLKMDAEWVSEASTAEKGQDRRQI